MSLVKIDSSGKNPRARWTDPRTGERCGQTFNPEDFTPAEQASWIANKEAELSRARRVARAAKTGTSIRSHVEAMLLTRPKLRASTKTLYRHSIRRFCDWGEEHGCIKTSQVTEEKLLDFKTSLVSSMDASTANKVQRNVHTFLRYLYDHKMLPEVSREGIAYGLRASDEVKKAKPLVNPAKLMAAFKGEDERTQAFVRTLLLTGMRFGECMKLELRNCQDLETRGCIELEASDTKTNAARTIWLQESPSVIPLLETQIRRAGIIREHRVWGGISRTPFDQAKARVIKAGFPPFTWQALRRTCGSYLTCAPGIYGGSSAFQSAKRLGHSVTIAERLYINSLRGIPTDAKTLEEAMGLDATAKA